MSKNTEKFEVKKDVWCKVGDNDRTLQTTDGFRVHVYKDKGGWSARVTDQQTTKFRLSRLPYVSDAEAKAACMRVIVEMRDHRNARSAPQGKLPL
jgi:hypothetical protein